jgi:hypothetical protein
MLQVIVSVVLPQSSLICTAPVITIRSRVFTPPAQSAVHDPHSLHSPSMHPSGQTCVLHSITSSTSVAFTEHEPPYLAGVIVRWRIAKPPPHFCVHSENALQSETVQSSGS